MFEELFSNAKISDEELVSNFRNGMENEVIAYIYNKHSYLFYQVSAKYQGLDSDTIESVIYEMIWKCLNNYDKSKSHGKLTTMICTYIRNELRTITQRNKASKRRINEYDACSVFSDFEQSDDRLEESSEFEDYTKIEMVSLLDSIDLTDNQRKYCDCAINLICELNMAQIAQTIGVSRAGAKRIKESLQIKLTPLLG